MNMTKLQPRCVDNIYYNNYYKYQDLLESVGLTLKGDSRYYIGSQIIVHKASLNDELWDAITWIQKRFWKITRPVIATEHKKENSRTVVSNFYYGSQVFEHDKYETEPPKEAFDLVEGFIFINKNHEIPESIKRMMDEEEAERMLRG